MVFVSGWNKEKLYVCIVVKSKVEISQNFVAFSEYMNFTKTQQKQVTKFRAIHDWDSCPQSIYHRDEKNGISLVDP